MIAIRPLIDLRFKYLKYAKVSLHYALTFYYFFLLNDLPFSIPITQEVKRVEQKTSIETDHHVSPLSENKFSLH